MLELVGLDLFLASNDFTDVAPHIFPRPLSLDNGSSEGRIHELTRQR